MVDWDPHADRIGKICNEWNHAEETIKLAEHIVHKVSTPSIKELRYAGRRMIEAFDKIRENKPASKINEVLQDAEFNCLRARHDAIDAATAKIGVDLQTAIEKIGYRAILIAFPNFSELNKSLNEIRDKVSISRKDRDNRDKIYTSLETGDFGATVQLYRTFLQNEPMMIAMAKKERLHLVISYVFSAIGIIIGIVGIGIALIAQSPKA